MRNKINSMLLGLVVLFTATSASATVVFPALALDTISITSTSSGLTMTGDVLTIEASDASTIFDFIPDLSFSLTSNAAGSGTLSVTGASTLSANFSNLSITHLFAGTGTWNADLTYTGGSLAGSLTSGRVEGGFGGVSGFGTGQSLLGENFTTSGGTAKIGAVVPVPAAVWLFGSGLLGLVGVARRKSAA